MNDSVFNTLAAVALMCSSHFHGLFSNEPTLTGGKYDAGFEQCVTISKAFQAETARRAKVAAAVKAEADKARLENGLAAVQGKSFTPEEVPMASTASVNSCTVLTNGTP